MTPEICACATSGQPRVETTPRACCCGESCRCVDCACSRCTCGDDCECPSCRCA
jgi:hypothetical protein